MIELKVALELVMNLSLLVALSIISGFIDKRYPRNSVTGMALQGLLFGGAAMLGMLRPLTLGPGLIFDGRSVLVGLCALFFGPWTTLIAVLMLIPVRIGMGGPGALMGVLVISSSAVIGLAAHYRWKSDPRPPTSGRIYLLGIVIHVVMVLLMFTLPENIAWTTIKRVGLPVILFYPLAMILAGKILSDQIDAWRMMLKLQESEEKHRVLLEESPDPIFSFTHEGRYTYINPAFAAGVGRSVEEIVGRTLWDVFPKEEADQRFAALRRALQSGVTEVIEVCVPRPEGDRYYVTTITPIRNEKGLFLSAICSSKEITARLKAEKQLENAVSELKRRMDEQQSLLEGAEAILRGEDFPTTARRIFDIARKMTGAQSGYVALLDATGEENEVLFLESGNLPCTVDPNLPMPVRGLRAEAYRTGKPVFDNDFMKSPWMTYMPEGHVDLRNVMFAPLNIEGKTVGIMGLANKPADFSENDLRMAEAFGQLAAIALGNSRTLDALTQSEQRFRMFADLAPVGIVVSDEKENVLYVSPTFIRMFGYTTAEMPSVREWWDLAYPDSEMRERAREEWAALMAKDRSGESGLHPLEFPVTCKDGTVRHVEFRLTTSGNMNIVVLSDVTERKRAEAQRAETHELLENLASLVPGVIYQYRLFPDGRSCFPWSSPGIRMIYEVDPDDVRKDAAPVFGRLHPDDADRVAEAIFQSARTLETFYCEFRVILPQQGIRWRWSQAQPVRMEDGGTLWHGIINDITELKKAEEERKSLETQLQQAMKMEAIGRLAGGIAHDFNNLLTAIQGFAELVLDGMDEREALREDVEEIRKAAVAAARLTSQLLAFSRKQLISPKVLDINGAIAQSEKMLRRIIGEDIDFLFVPGEKTGKVLIDPGQVDQILINLAVNARDAMPGGGKLTIETENAVLDEKRCRSCGEQIAGPFVRFTVTDNGPGMNQETMANIFEPFFTTKERGKGTGLGLSTVHGIVHQNKGHINVYSEPGVGTSFKIYLPIVDEEAEPELRQEEPELIGGSETILVVEDQELVRKLAVRTLSMLGYRIVEAENGNDALRLFRESKETIDLLLTDVVMPGMSGKELHLELIELEPGLKALFMSGYTENAIAHHGVLDKGVNFIQKPFRPQELAAKVRQVLDEKRLAAQDPPRQV